MADDVREYIRAAQQAEQRGDTAQAVAFLQKAARLYRGAGNTTRALTMLRHASRLDGGRRAQLEEEIRRLEWVPEDPLSRAIGADEPEEESGRSEEDDALQALDAFGEESNAQDRQLIERGPTKADPSLQAWCSFCCRPKTEAGELVAGPASAFICLGCVKECVSLLAPTQEAAPIEAGALPGAETRCVPDTEPGQSRLENRPAVVELVGQGAATSSLDAAMRTGARWILLIGPEGTGKTSYLRGLEQAGLGRYLCAGASLESAAPEQRLLIDLGESSGEGAHGDWWESLVALEPSSVVLACRGALADAGLRAKSDELELQLPTTKSLSEATAQRLPLWLLRKVQWVASFAPLSAEALEELARRMLARRAAELDVSEELVRAIASEAARSGAGGHELTALVERLPPGSWRAATPAPAKRKRRPKKSEG